MKITMQKKAVWMLVLVTVLLLAFVGCGEGDPLLPEGSGTSSQPVTTAGATVATVLTTDPAAEPVTNPATNPTVTSAEPATETSAEPATETSAEPATETSAEPATETSAEPATETSAEPATETSAEPVTDATTDPVTEEPPVPVEPTLSLGGVDISEYVIVYEVPDEKSAVGSYWKQEYHTGKVTAERLAALLKERFGVEVKIYADASRNVGEKEILIGNTNRDESKTDTVTSLADDDYYIGMSNGKLVICGGAPGTTYHAIDSLETYFATDVENSAYVIDENSDLSGNYHLKRIAFLGDSITYGALATNYQTNGALLGFPKQVGRMYWQECTVTVYAQPGINLRSDLNGFIMSSLWTNFKTDLYKKGYDAVLIMLGTNDSYTDTKTGDTWDGVWTDADDKSFLNTYTSMVSQINRLAPDTEIVIMNCPVYYRTAETHASHYHSSPRVLALQKQAALELKEAGYNVHFYDMNAYTTANTPKSMYSDLLHPNDAGHEIIAKGVVTMLKLLFAGETDQYLIN